MLASQPSSPLFPYTTLFRSDCARAQARSIDEAWSAFQLSTESADGTQRRHAPRGAQPLRSTPQQMRSGILATVGARRLLQELDRKSTRLNSSHVRISYAVFC